MVAQIKWTERTFDFNLPSGMFPIIFSRLEGSIFRIFNLLSHADDGVTSLKPPQGWTVKEHLGHLSDLEELWQDRIEDFLQARPMLTPADISNPKTEQAGHNEKSIETLVENFSLLRQKTLERIYPLDETTLQTRSLHQRLQVQMSLVDALNFCADHDDHHIAAISTLLRQPEPGFVEAL